MERSGSVRRDSYLDLEGRSIEVWLRRAALLVLAAACVAVLLGLIGQRPKSSTAQTAAATLVTRAPTRLRGGLYYQARFTVTAKRRIERPHLVLNGGWFEGMTLNTTEPEPSSELSRGGSVVLVYDTLDAGQQLHVWMEFQVNPTTVGGRTQTVELDDGTTPLARIERKATVFP